MYQNRYGSRDWSGWLAIYSTIITVALAASISYNVYRPSSESRSAMPPKTDTEDAARLSELHAHHGAIEVQILMLPDGKPTPPALEKALRERATEYNVILARHPTWTAKPLTTTVLVR